MRALRKTRVLYTYLHDQKSQAEHLTSRGCPEATQSWDYYSTIYLTSKSVESPFRWIQIVIHEIESDQIEQAKKLASSTRDASQQHTRRSDTLALNLEWTIEEHSPKPIIISTHNHFLALGTITDFIDNREVSWQPSLFRHASRSKFRLLISIHSSHCCSLPHKFLFRSFRHSHCMRRKQRKELFLITRSKVSRTSMQDNSSFWEKVANMKTC